MADYAVTHTISWNGLNDEGLIFGKDYVAGGVGYTLRAPSVGSDSTGWDDSQRGGSPQSNEWDTMLNKNSGYIQNWNKNVFVGTGCFFMTARRPARSVGTIRPALPWATNTILSSGQNVKPCGFLCPVLEVLNPDTLGDETTGL